FCSKNSRVLLRRGILYPVHGLAFAEQSHAPLVACYLPFHDHSIGPVRGRIDVVRSLREEIEARPIAHQVTEELIFNRNRVCLFAVRSKSPRKRRSLRRRDTPPDLATRAAKRVNGQMRFASINRPLSASLPWV